MSLNGLWYGNQSLLDGLEWYGKNFPSSPVQVWEIVKGRMEPNQINLVDNRLELYLF